MISLKKTPLVSFQTDQKAGLTYQMLVNVNEREASRLEGNYLQRK